MSTHPHDLPDWLVADDRRESSPHVYPAGDRRVQPIDTVVIHWTASPYQPRGPLGADEARIRSWGRGERGETIHARNTSAAVNITVTDLNVVITEIK